MEVSAFKHPAGAGVPARMVGRSPLLRLQSDERLVALTRRGSHAAFEALVGRYQSRLLAFCRHMVSSREDAEDVLQEVFAASFNALLADERAVNVRPWLYRIARNRCLNHLRRTTAIGVDSMDHHIANHGQTTADQVHEREEFRLLLGDVSLLPETQRTALLLREIDALSYDQIAEAMDTTVPSVKSLLVRARVGLAEAAEARRMTCEEVRLELGEWAEGLKKPSPPVRRHVRDCPTCTGFRAQLKQNNRALAAVLPLGPLIVFKKLALFSFGSHAASSTGGAATSGAAAGLAGVGAAGSSGVISASLSAVAAKAAAGLAAAAIVTAGAVEVDSASRHRAQRAQPQVAARSAPALPVVTPQPVTPTSAPARRLHKRAHHVRVHTRRVKRAPAPAATAPATVPIVAPAAKPAPKPATAPAQSVSATTTLPTTPATCPSSPPAGTTTTPAPPTSTTPTTPAAPAGTCPPAPTPAPTAPPTAPPAPTAPPVTTPPPPTPTPPVPPAP